MWIASPERAIDMLIHVMELPGERMGLESQRQWTRDRGERSGSTRGTRAPRGTEARRRVRFEPDAAIAKIVLSWPVRFVTARADQLGFKGDADVGSIIRAHMQALDPSA